jgi:hypothetical protein
MQPDSFWAKIVRASRPGRPLLRITASPWWTDVLVAAGAQRGNADDGMVVSFRGHRHDSAVWDRSLGPVIQARQFHDARSIGELFRSGEPVVMDLRGMTDDDARRLVDFAAGLIFGLRGSIDKFTNRVFLLTPASDEVAPASWDSAYDGIVITTNGRIIIRSERDRRRIWMKKDRGIVITLVQAKHSISDDANGVVYNGDLLDLLDAVPSR